MRSEGEEAKTGHRTSRSAKHRKSKAVGMCALAHRAQSQQLGNSSLAVCSEHTYSLSCFNTLSPKTAKPDAVTTEGSFPTGFLPDPLLPVSCVWNVPPPHRPVSVGVLHFFWGPSYSPGHGSHHPPSSHCLALGLLYGPQSPSYL